MELVLVYKSQEASLEKQNELIPAASNKAFLRTCLLPLPIMIPRGFGIFIASMSKESKFSNLALGFNLQNNNLFQILCFASSWHNMSISPASRTSESPVMPALQATKSRSMRSFKIRPSHCKLLLGTFIAFSMPSSTSLWTSMNEQNNNLQSARSFGNSQYLSCCASKMLMKPSQWLASTRRQIQDRGLCSGLASMP